MHRLVRIHAVSNTTPAMKSKLAVLQYGAALIRTLSVGDAAEIVRTIKPEDVAIFAQVTGDTNPIHLDEAAARTSRFGTCIVHGAFLNGVVSGLLGTILPGPGTIVAHQYLEFPNALFVGEEVKAKVEITLIKRSLVECAFVCEATQRQKIVLKGYAKLVYRDLK